MARYKHVFSWLTLVLALMAGCTPKAPSPTQSPLPVVPVPETARPVAPAATAEDPAWDKIVSAAKKEGVLTSYSFYFVSDIGRALAQAFRDKYGIRVEILPGAGRQTVEKIKVEQRLKLPIADVVDSGVSSATELTLAGLNQSIAHELPSLRDKSVFKVDPTYSPGGEVLFFSVGIIGPLINTKLIGAGDEPRSWHDFVDPKLKGKIITVDPRGGGAGMFMFFSTMRYFKVLDDDYFRRLAPNLQMWGGSSQELYRMVARGEYPIGIHASNHSSATLIAEGAPVKVLPIEEGNIAQGESITMVKGAPHPNAARLFLNWMLSPEGQMTYAKASSTSPLRLDVIDFLIPEAQLKPKKIINRTWDAAEQSNQWLKEGVADMLFGKK